MEVLKTESMSLAAVTIRTNRRETLSIADLQKIETDQRSQHATYRLDTVVLFPGSLWPEEYEHVL